MLEPRQMNEDGLDVREANHRVMKMSDQGRPTAERLPLSAAPQFLGWLQAPSVRNSSKRVPSSQDRSGNTIPRRIER